MLWRIWSYTRPVLKFAKVVVKGIWPPMVNPAAMPIMFASAIPTSTNLSGKSLINGPSLNEPAKSAVNTIAFAKRLPTS